MRTRVGGLLWLTYYRQAEQCLFVVLVNMDFFFYSIAFFFALCIFHMICFPEISDSNPSASQILTKYHS